MPELRITGVSNNQLELQAPDGTRHYLEISEDLLKALRQREVSLPPSLSPREIQQQIRLGATVEDVVAATGADQELVLRFAKPIIAELNHIVALARSIRLSLAGDRFAEPVPVEFGEVMDERLAVNGSTNSSWSARKSIEGEWLVSINFHTSQGDGVATWSFDPKKLFLAPENEAALQLSNGVPVSAISKTVPLVAETPIEVAQSEHPATFLSVVPEAVPEVIESDIDLFAEEPVNTANLRIVPEIATETFENESTFTEAVETIHVVEEETIAEPESNVSIEEMQTENKPQINSRWAEVLFGSKEDEEETF